MPLSNPFHLGGFASLYNPMLIETAEFYAGGTPARYEPALSGVLEVRYVTGETTGLKAQVDVSMHTAKALVNTPTGVEGLSVLLAARRSYFELYFAGAARARRGGAELRGAGHRRVPGAGALPARAATS